MIQMALSNLGIILLMHLLVNTAYHLESWGKLTSSHRELIQIGVTSAAIILLFYFPIHTGEVAFDLRIVPILYIAILKDRKFIASLVLITSVYRFFMVGPEVFHEILFTIFLPALLPQFIKIKDGYTIRHSRIFALVTFTFLLVQSFNLFHLHQLRLESFLSFDFFFNYAVTIATAVVFYYFITTAAITRRLRMQIMNYADHDQLTGLYNIRKFNQVTSQMVHVQHKHQAFIAMIDIDNFKQINDQYGHPIGDFVISRVAELLKQTIVDDFIIGRYGGDEFILYFHSLSKNEAHQTLTQIKNKINKINLAPLHLQKEINISLSIGVAPYDPSSTLQATMKTADEFLYRSKQDGKNLVTTA